MSNAIDYNHDGGEVRVMTRRHDQTAILTVSDTGPGISAEGRPHLFERFQRADKARTGRGGHSGLGLAIAQAVVHAHGGNIEVESEPGRGSTFIMHLPG